MKRKIKVKICQILAGYGDGGLEKHTIELSYALKSKGIDVTVIADKKFSKAFQEVDFIEMDLTKGRSNPFVLWKLYNILKKEQFDIIHTQANKATDMVTKLKPFLDAKIVATLHNFKKNVKPFLKADRVITVSDRIGEKLIHDNKVTVYNGINIADNISLDIYGKFDIPTEKFIICSVGRLVEAKGFDLLIKSLQYMDHDIALLLIGDGPDREKLEKLSHKYNIANRIVFVGNIKNELTKRIIKASDLLVISSRREGFSYVFAESLLLNTPIVSTDVADIKKFITSKYIPEFEPKSFAKKVNDFKRDYDHNIIEYKKIFNRAQNTFTLENMTEQTIKVYDQAMN